MIIVVGGGGVDLDLSIFPAFCSHTLSGWSDHIALGGTTWDIWWRAAH